MVKQKEEYEKAFKPNKLCNWEVSKSGSIVPKGRVGATKVIANDRGHLLPGIRKLNLWTGTRVLTDRVPVPANHSTDKMGHSGDILTSWERRSSHVPVVPQEKSALKALPCTAVSRRSSIDKENGSVKNVMSREEINSAEATQRSHESNKSKTNTIDEQQNHDKGKIPAHLSRSTSQTSEPLLAKAYSNHLIAKNLKLYNQKHHALADAVDTSRKAKLLDAEAKTDNWIPAIGCKLFQSPGPTQCSKLKVFRPKSTTNVMERQESVSEERPKTAPRSKRLSEMDLAIYWDASMPPQSPKETSKIGDILPPPNTIIEVKTNVENTDATAKNDSHGKPIPPLADAVISTLAPERKHSSISNSNANSRCTKEIRKSISNLPEATTADLKLTNLSDGRCAKLYASAPNLINVGVQVNPANFRTTARMCEACNVKSSSYNKPSTISVEPYKLAFKAGVPNALTVNDQTTERLHKARHLHVPKPKMPYAKKSYTIGTLMPPFSVWPRAAGQDYPDHWRLASVYQHSYKPLETRKVPLMRTVFQ